MSTKSEQNRESYLKAKAEGAYSASKRDSTWDQKKHMHTCCGSKHGAYHKSACPIRNGDISDLKMNAAREIDPVKLRVRELKEQGYTSIVVAEKLGMPLKDVNKLWIG